MKFVSIIVKPIDGYHCQTYHFSTKAVNYMKQLGIDEICNLFTTFILIISSIHHIKRDSTDIF